MWDNGRTPMRVIEHGVQPLQEAAYRGDLASGLVVVNHLAQRGRRLGLDVFRQVASRVPLSLVGMGSQACGGEGEVDHSQLPQRMASHRFFFHPVRYTSLGLAVIEAMLIGTPVVALATTELATVIRDGENGFVDTSIDRLVRNMGALLADPVEARRLGAAGQATARERFHIQRFISDWLDAFAQITA